MGLNYKKSRGFTLVAILIACIIILAIVWLVYFKNTEETKNVVETKQQAEVQIEQIEKQINQYNQRIEEQAGEAME